jgi:S1-C subfamily serine protease
MLVIVTQSKNRILLLCLLVLGAAIQFASATQKTDLVDLIKQHKPSVVGIGLFAPLNAKAPQLLGTGFVVGNGSQIVTNYHVVSKELDPSIVEYFVALSGEGPRPKLHKMEMIGIDPVHDLALFSIEDVLPPLTLASNSLVDSGTEIIMTGFPIGAVLGLYPATHRGIVAAIAPDVNPAKNANELTLKMLERLKAPFLIYQLDITAFPGNSGSPVFDRETGDIIGVLNKVFVSEGKESALSNPSGISYAIPVKHLKKLANDNNIEL